ncbi:hypothetical protein ACGF1Z_34905 [Streptomyces sp. NPDC048018]|uniref:hypothetical protein n=1 Tax=Streptomyces sp. NPDC048018 TaxID=3365499 RepID=UPI003718CB29
MRRTKAAVVTGALLAGLFAASAAPAQADTCKRAGLQVVCEYTVLEVTLPGSVRQEFVVGSDRAVWTRWTDASGRWGSWMSMGGRARSAVGLAKGYINGGEFSLLVIGDDNGFWANDRDAHGNWSGWHAWDGCCG